MKFEGHEKKLEIVLKDGSPCLMSMKEDFWVGVVKECGAEILSTIGTDTQRAYLLSESSLFITSSRLVMITCGKTNLTKSLPVILKEVSKKNVEYIFYERKRLMFPESQTSDFEREVAFIGRYFSGHSYRLGASNEDHVHIFMNCESNSPKNKDITLEILMSDLEESTMKLFNKSAVSDNIKLRRQLGLDSLYELKGYDDQFLYDDYVFDPQGYSLNALFEEQYFTFHVTPQPHQSYVSFESNIIQEDYSLIISKVLKIFNPKKAIIFITRSKKAKVLYKVPDSYTAIESCAYNFPDGYDLMYKRIKLGD